MKVLAIVIALLAMLSGCATRPTQQQMESADYGNYPSDHEQLIRGYMGQILKDPDSARYQFLNSPKTGWSSLGGLKFGYVVCVNINAKNSYGGYTGNRLSYFMIHNDKIIDTAHGDGSYGEAFVQGKCKSFI